MTRRRPPCRTGVDEFEFCQAGGGPQPHCNAAARGGSPAALECKLAQIIQLHGADGSALDQYLTIGEVVGVHIDRAYLREGLFDLLATHPVQRAGYVADYTEATIGFKWNGRK